MHNFRRKRRRKKKGNTNLAKDNINQMKKKKKTPSQNFSSRITKQFQHNLQRRNNLEDT